MYLLTHSHQKNYMTIFNTFTKLILIAALLLNGIAFGVSSDAQFNTDLMFKRKGTNQCFDSSTNSNGGRLETVDCVPTNPNQRFQKQDVGNGYFLIKVRNMCLNAYNPSNGSVLNMWNCNPSDNDMKWRMVGGQSNVIQRFGTNYCINANLSVNGKAPNIWTCDDYDGDQKWDIYTPNTTISPAPATKKWKYEYYIVAISHDVRFAQNPWNTGHAFTGIVMAEEGTENWITTNTFGASNDRELDKQRLRMIARNQSISGIRYAYRAIKTSESRANWIIDTGTNPGSKFGPNCDKYRIWGGTGWFGDNFCSCVDSATRQWRKATNGNENFTPNWIDGITPAMLMDKLRPFPKYYDNGNLQD
jgi:hypothetical protein